MASRIHLYSGQSLGKGVTGSVTKARVDGEIVAAKRINFTGNFQSSSLMRALFIREVEILNLLQGVPGVLKLVHHELYQNEGILVTELLHQTLEGRLTNHPGEPVPDQILLPFSRSLLFALANIHAANVVHRDIKPENIMFRRVSGSETEDTCAWMTNDGKETAVFIDFGLSRRVSPSEIMTTRVGSYFTFAPELIMDKGYTQSADVFSLGVVLFLAAHGHLPHYPSSFTPIRTYSIKSVIEQAWRKGTWSPITTRWIPKLAPVLEGMLQIDPKKRLTAFQALELLDPTLAKSICSPLPTPIIIGRCKALEPFTSEEISKLTLVPEQVPKLVQESAEHTVPEVDEPVRNVSVEPVGPEPEPKPIPVEPVPVPVPVPVEPEPKPVPVESEQPATVEPEPKPLLVDHEPVPVEPKPRSPIASHNRSYSSSKSWFTSRPGAPSSLLSVASVRRSRDPK